MKKESNGKRKKQLLLPYNQMNYPYGLDNRKYILPGREWANAEMKRTGTQPGGAHARPKAATEAVRATAVEPLAAGSLSSPGLSSGTASVTVTHLRRSLSGVRQKQYHLPPLRNDALVRASAAQIAQVNLKDALRYEAALEYSQRNTIQFEETRELCKLRTLMQNVEDTMATLESSEQRYMQAVFDTQRLELMQTEQRRRAMEEVEEEQQVEILISHYICSLNEIRERELLAQEEQDERIFLYRMIDTQRARYNSSVAAAEAAKSQRAEDTQKQEVEQAAVEQVPRVEIRTESEGGSAEEEALCPCASQRDVGACRSAAARTFVEGVLAAASAARLSSDTPSKPVEVSASSSYALRDELACELTNAALHELPATPKTVGSCGCGNHNDITQCRDFTSRAYVDELFAAADTAVATALVPAADEDVKSSEILPENIFSASSEKDTMSDYASVPPTPPCDQECACGDISDIVPCRTHFISDLLDEVLMPYCGFSSEEDNDPKETMDPHSLSARCSDSEKHDDCVSSCSCRSDADVEACRKRCVVALIDDILEDVAFGVGSPSPVRAGVAVC